MSDHPSPQTRLGCFLSFILSGFCCLCSFGEFVAPNKTLSKKDHYQGHWRDGKMHGLGTYR